MSPNDKQQKTGGILIVEDSPVMVRTLTGLLQANGYTIAGVASDGIEALQMFKVTNPDIVLMDINMPKLNGVDATKGILTLDPDAKVVIVSVASDREIVLRAMAAGAKDYIAKPIKPDRLCSVINKLLEG